MQTLTEKHPMFEEFCTALEGPDGCDFREDERGRITWTCGGGHDKSKSRAILEKIPDIDVEATLEYFDQHGGHCDCEVLFNVAG